MRGNIDEVLAFLALEMDEAASHLKFELAASLKEKYRLLQQYQSRSTVVSKSIHNVDVFSLAHDEQYAFVNYLIIG